MIVLKHRRTCIAIVGLTQSRASGVPRLREQECLLTSYIHQHDLSHSHFREIMGTVEELADGFCASTAAIDAQPFALRSYQAEMVEESLRSNIIVVMDTGSGKTHMFVR